MKKDNINHKTIFIVENHHEIIQAWDKFQPTNIFCLDYHTDTKQAFLHHVYYKLKSSFQCSNPAMKDVVKYANIIIDSFKTGKLSISKCINKLKHDEFIDFAIKAELINQIFIFGASTNCNNKNNNVLIVEDDIRYKPKDIKPILQYSPNLNNFDEVIEDCYLHLGIDKINELNPEFLNNFIFDIDLDYFNTRKSIEPENKKIIFELINKAQAITISLEREYVEDCRLNNETIDSDYLLSKLKKLICEAQKS